MSTTVFSATLPDGTEQRRTSKTKSYTHAVIVREESGWGVLGFSQSEENAKKMIKKWRQARFLEMRVVPATKRLAPTTKAEMKGYDLMNASEQARIDEQVAALAPEEPSAQANIKPITDRNLAPGTMLVATYKGQNYTLTVVEKRWDSAGGENAVVERGYEMGGKTYKSPSGAGSAIFGLDSQGKPRTCAGWNFWKIAG